MSREDILVRRIGKAICRALDAEGVENFSVSVENEESEDIEEETKKRRNIVAATCELKRAREEYDRIWAKAKADFQRICTVDSGLLCCEIAHKKYAKIRDDAEAKFLKLRKEIEEEYPKLKGIVP